MGSRKQMVLIILDKGDLFCVVMERRVGNNGKSFWEVDFGLGIKNDLLWKDE